MRQERTLCSSSLPSRFTRSSSTDYAIDRPANQRRPRTTLSGRARAAEAAGASRRHPHPWRASPTAVSATAIELLRPAQAPDPTELQCQSANSEPASGLPHRESHSPKPQPVAQHGGAGAPEPVANAPTMYKLVSDLPKRGHQFEISSAHRFRIGERYNMGDQSKRTVLEFFRTTGLAGFFRLQRVKSAKDA